jgi:hypothetical protein
MRSFPNQKCAIKINQSFGFHVWTLLGSAFGPWEHLESKSITFGKLLITFWMSSDDEFWWLGRWSFSLGALEIFFVVLELFSWGARAFIPSHPALFHWFLLSWLRGMKFEIWFQFFQLMGWDPTSITWFRPQKFSAECHG